MKKYIVVFISFFVLVLLAAVSNAAQVSVISKETLKSWMDEGPVVVLDARQGRDWKSSEFKIKGAKRAAPKNFSTWKNELPKDKKIVIYCA